MPEGEDHPASIDRLLMNFTSDLLDPPCGTEEPKDEGTEERDDPSQDPPARLVA